MIKGRLAYRTFKTCQTCGETQHISEFYKNRKNEDGYFDECKTCYYNKHGEKDWYTRKNRNDKDKQKTRNRTRTLIVNGKIEKKKYCERCGTSHRLEIHHRDYNNPYDIETLCTSCHRKEHGRR